MVEERNVLNYAICHPLFKFLHLYFVLHFSPNFPTLNKTPLADAFCSMDTSTRVMCSCPTRVETDAPRTLYHKHFSFFIKNVFLFLLKFLYIFNSKLLVNNKWVCIFKRFQQEKLITSIKLNSYYGPV